MKNPTQNIVITALVTSFLTTIFWWATPFIVRVKCRKAGEEFSTGIKEGLAKAFEPSKESKAEDAMWIDLVNKRINFDFEGNTKVTITNNTDLEIESLLFEYLNEEGMEVASGMVFFGLLGDGGGKALKSGRTAKMDIHAKETIKPAFKVRPAMISFTTGKTVHYRYAK